MEPHNYPRNNEAREAYAVLSQLPQLKISYEPKLPPSKLLKISSSADAHEIFRAFFNPENMKLKEEAAVLLLNRANRVLCVNLISSGGITGTVVDIRLILGIALKALACSIMVAHTHPSGNLQPSKIDELLTVKLREAARIMDIVLLDHLILSTESYYSFADEGRL